MAANDQIACSARFAYQTVTDDVIPLVDAVHYTMLDETDPKTSVFVNGGRPNGGGILVRSAPRWVRPGEYLLVQIKPTATKTLDSTGSTSGVLIIGILVKDHVTGATRPRFLTEADRNTTRVPDDGSKTADLWNDAYAFLVPNGQSWQLFGLWRADFRTTA